MEERAKREECSPIDVVCSPMLAGGDGSETEERARWRSSESLEEVMLIAKGCFLRAAAARSDRVCYPLSVSAWSDEAHNGGCCSHGWGSLPDPRLVPLFATRVAARPQLVPLLARSWCRCSRLASLLARSWCRCSRLDEMELLSASPAGKMSGRRTSCWS
ncbi:hypothetical protein Dimus_019367 [Dionaea muscipula]